MLDPHRLPRERPCKFPTKASLHHRSEHRRHQRSPTLAVTVISWCFLSHASCWCFKSSLGPHLWLYVLWSRWPLPPWEPSNLGGSCQVAFRPTPWHIVHLCQRSLCYFRGPTRSFFCLHRRFRACGLSCFHRKWPKLSVLSCQSSGRASSQASRQTSL